MILLSMEKKLLNKVICFILLFSFSLSCSNDRGISRRNSTLACRYLIDTLTIDNPVLVVYEDALFIMSRDHITEFASNPYYSESKDQKFFRILPHNVRMDIFDDGLNEFRNNSNFTDRAYEHIKMASSARSGLYSSICFNYSERTIYEDKVGCVEYYSFNPQPKRFVLELVYYDPQRYKENPYGPHWTFITEESSGPTLFMNKLDSLESVPIISKEEEEPHYMFTLEPLYSRETINAFIRSNDSIKIVRFNLNKGHIFIDLTPKYFTKQFAKKHCFPDL